MPTLHPQRPTRLLSALGVALAASAAARAALWEDPRWAVTGTAEVTAGYDSNLFAVNSGPSDDFATFRPSVDLTRKDSPFAFDTTAWASWTNFDRLTGDDSFDPGVKLTLSYPADTAQTIATQSAEIHYIRSTSVNLDVGDRLSQDDAFAGYAGNLLDTGKLLIDGRASFDRDEYLGSAYTTVNTATFGSTVSYAPQELFKAGVGYDLTFGRSEPNTSGYQALDRTEQAVTLQVAGEFTPKVTGTASIGEAYSQYTGYSSYDAWDVVAGADLTWKPLERLAIDLKAARAPSFDADGDVDVNSTVTLSLLQELRGGFAVHADGTIGRSVHQQIVTYRTDNIEGAGAGLDYNLTGKLVATLGYEWTHQNSDIEHFTYQRDVVTVQLTYKF
jgi:opacity protein-like surface antigen